MRVGAFFLAGAVMTGTVLGQQTAPAPATSPTTAPAFKLQIGYDTTRVTGPVRPDGTVDYAAALWERLHQGVTKENNAYPVLLMMAAKFKPVPAKAEAYPPNPSLSYLTIEDKTTLHPWKAKDYPEMAAWLKDNDKVFAWAQTLTSDLGMKRWTRWCPPKPAPETKDYRPMPWTRQIRQISEALQIRAMMRLGEDDQHGAMSDAETVRRLANLLESEPLWISWMMPESFHGHTARLALQGARAGNLADKRRWLAFVMSIPKPSLPPEMIDGDIRFQSLSEVMEILRGNAQSALSNLTMLSIEQLFFPKATGVRILPGDLDQVDWNIVLRRMNAVTDDEVRISREPPQQAHQDALKFSKLLEKVPAPGNFFTVLGGMLLSPKKGTETQQKESLEQQVADFLKRGANESRDTYSKRIAGYFVKTSGASFYLMPEDILTFMTYRRAYEIAIALEIYHDQHGSYPQNLAALVPALLPGIPQDPFSHKKTDLLYALRGNDYIIYSVGSSGHDTPSYNVQHPSPEDAVYSANNPNAPIYER